MKKLESQGFIIVETLIVSAFVLGIFTFIYVNVIPLIGIYEQRNTYDDIESIYNIDTIRDNLDLSSLNSNIIYQRADACETDPLCQNMLAAMEIDYIGLIKAGLIDAEDPDGLGEYLDYIGEIAENEERIIIVKRHQDKYSGDDNNLNCEEDDPDCTKKIYPVRFANLKQVQVGE